MSLLKPKFFRVSCTYFCAAFFLLLSFKSIAQINCSPASNMLTNNPSFELGSTGWTFGGGTFTTLSGNAACGSLISSFTITNAASNFMRHEFWASPTPGSTIYLSAFAAVNNASAYNRIYLEFLNASFGYLGGIEKEINKVITDAPLGLRPYELSYVVPAGTAIIRVAVSGAANTIFTDHWVLSSAPINNCNPNDGSAFYGFCAPASSTIASANLIWSQSIDVDNGNPSTIRLYDNGPVSYTIPVALYPAILTSGSSVVVNINEVVSYDGYEARSNVTVQPNERWRIVFTKNGFAVFTSDWTADIADNQKQSNWVGALNSAVLPQGADEVKLEHWSQGTGNAFNGPNSVIPTSVKISVTAGSVLPLQISSFSAEKIDENKANLKWVAVEQNQVLNYDIEESIDGINFKVIVTVANNGAENATYNQSISMPNAKVVYYKIKANQADGRQVFSVIKAIKIIQSKKVEVYPNPVNTSFAKLSIPAEYVGIKSSTGASLINQNYRNIKAIENIDVSKLSNGNYIVTVSTSNQLVSNINLVVVK
jgi:hypothetical protein